MADLPINISNALAKTAAIKSPAHDDVAQQDTQDFGDVLSRQVADSAKPATSNQTSSGNSGKQAADQENTDTAAAGDAATTTPADMLAALLAQQNQASLPATDVTGQTDPASLTEVAAQTVATAQPSANLPSALILQTTAATSGQPVMAAAAATASDIAQPKIEVPAKDGKGFAEVLKASGMKEIGLSANSKTLGANTISDMTSAPQQPVILPLLTAAAANASPLTINTPVNQPAWGDEFGQKIIWMANQRNQSAELHLNPPQLGPLEVVLKMNGDQATAMFTSPHAAVREAIEQAIPKLREMLADNGITLGQAMVSDHTAKNGQNNAPRNPPGRLLAEESNGGDGNLQELRVTGISRHNGMVDTFA